VLGISRALTFSLLTASTFTAAGCYRNSLSDCDSAGLDVYRRVVLTWCVAWWYMRCFLTTGFMSDSPAKRIKTDSMSAVALSEKCINQIRVIAAETVQSAKSGHPGAPMGCAPMAHLLWSEVRTSSIGSCQSLLIMLVVVQSHAWSYLVK
jgi:hypothetical protein